MVDEIAYLGDMSIFHVRLENGAVVKVARTNRARSQAEEITWETQVNLSWSPEAAAALLN